MSSKGVLVYAICTLVVATLAELPVYKLGKKSYYFDVSNTKNWFEAYEFCRKNGFRLLTLDDNDQCNFAALTDFLKAQNVSGNIWTSGTNFDGGWRWMTTGLPIISSNWNEENLSKKEQQMAQLIPNEDFKLNPHDADKVNNFLCEVEPKKESLNCVKNACSCCSA